MFCAVRKSVAVVASFSGFCLKGFYGGIFLMGLVMGGALEGRAWWGRVPVCERTCSDFGLGVLICDFAINVVHI